MKAGLLEKKAFCFCESKHYKDADEMWVCAGGSSWCPFRGFIHKACSKARGEKVEDDDSEYRCFFCSEFEQQIKEGLAVKRN